jgi:hypothetical protein
MTTKTIKERVAAINKELTEADLNSWEKQFLFNIVNYATLSEKQERVLVKLEDKAGIEGNKKDPFKVDGTLEDYPF